MWGYMYTIKKIFEVNGYSIQQHDNGTMFFADRKEDAFLVSVRGSRNPELGQAILTKAVNDVKRAADLTERDPVLVVLASVSEEQREPLTEGSILQIIDIHNLLYMVQNHSELKTSLVAELTYSVDLYLPGKPKIPIADTILLAPSEDLDYEDSDAQKEQRQLASLIDLLEDWQIISTGGTAYERVCCDVLKRLFADDLALWREQQNSAEGLFRFDLICKVKNKNAKEFWNMAERYFDSKYIVFEFKNYNRPIGQREVFTTVKYLYQKALRGVAILISANGIDEHGKQAIRGILREEGKLILPLNNRDLIEMLDMKKNNEDPSDYLSDKLDELLIDLEK